MKLWTENHIGNVHTAAAKINDAAPELVPHLITLHSPDGLTSIAVYRVPAELYAKLQHQRLHPPAEGATKKETVVVSGGADGMMFALDMEPGRR